ncbi:IS4 family transposase [Chamaesiphon minutus]|uniref:Transposase family protein n=1 Tax=Chamaesiphon minutus (strain ATCC 27169 / PCC 6605) TaxID=1173020 RepID=K9UDI6_CHAP6|nr:IS4 family transposase [Chamaesiphon minutus]AFY92713.1 transposase family protein [Chamaesiphon minutus PCC 6605]
MVSNFPAIVKRFLKDFPTDDYPVLDTFTFGSCWMSFVMDQSQSSMRDLFKRLNIRGIEMDISTFSKASKNRDPIIFHDLFLKSRNELRKKNNIDSKALVLFPIDSTIISLTSKLLWKEGYHQVKLFSGINLLTAEPDGILIHFGQGHDSKYGEETIAATPKNGVSVMDRGFCKLERIKNLIQDRERYFVIRIKNDMSLEMLENGKFLVGTGTKKVECRIVNYCDLEERTEFRLATNLPETGEFAVSNKEIGEFYRNRWQIELLWKFLKMHLKLDRLITKNTNGIEIQIYCCLIAYIVLQLVETPKEFGEKILDKLRYLQAFMCENISYVHWFRKMVFEQ